MNKPRTERALRRHRAVLIEMVDESIACTEECHQGWVDALNEFDAEHPGFAFDDDGDRSALAWAGAEARADLEQVEADLSVGAF